MTKEAISYYTQKFEEYKCCVLIPTYNNDQTLAQVIEDVLEYTPNILVVNDGSTDQTAEILTQYPNIHVHTHSPNQGKGMALRNGFKEALKLGFEYLITIDSDGQHYAKDLTTFIDHLTEHPKSILIGSRNMEQENVPNKSSFGNKFSSFWLWVETGVKLKDTQSGYRLYPIKALQNLRFFTKKYEFEVEVLVRAAWEDIELMCIPIDVYYPPQDERISHFRPFKDFTRISILNTVLFTLAFLWYRPRLFFKRLKKKTSVNL